ncbi:MAG: hypothetical protein EXQ97_05980 [Alphaproteobacteria bacterium]|nr:hypothetical protein [Alphaproteobacteria bacterium]
MSSFPPGKAFAHNVEAIGYCDLEGRPAFKLALHKAGDRWYLYTATFWHPGINIVEVTDPKSPRYVRFLPGPENTWTLQVQIADGKMVSSYEKITPGWGDDPTKGYDEGFVVWSLADPENPKKLGQWKSGGEGTHRNYYDGGRYVHATGLPEGYQGHIYQIVDIEDPANPKEVGRWWLDGQWTAGGEKGRPFGTMLHGGAYRKGDRAYLPYSASGFIILDVSDYKKPKLVSELSFSPPFKSFIGVHTVVPLRNSPHIVINSEEINENCDEPLGYAGIVEVKDETKPRLISLFPLPQVPEGAPYKTFIEKGGRFGPHNQHQHQWQDHLYGGDELAFLTYFNAGLRIYDISDVHVPKEVGWFMPPDPVERRGPLPATRLVAQTEDVIVDSRGNIFVSDKNHGVYCLRFNGL